MNLPTRLHAVIIKVLILVLIMIVREVNQKLDLIQILRAKLIFSSLFIKKTKMINYDL